MTLLAFQRAMAALAASPSLCLRARANPAMALTQFDLSAREIDRLGAIVWQRGMSTNCSLYRSNRLTPLYTHLPLTCTLLDAKMITVVERFWQACGTSDLQFKPEVERFAAFLRALGGELDDRLQSVLEFELAINALLYVPRRGLDLVDQRRSPPHADERLLLHPLVRVARFPCKPGPLLGALAVRRPPPVDTVAGEHYLVLRASADDLDVDAVDLELGRVLWRLRSGDADAAGTEQRASLLRAGLAVEVGWSQAARYASSSDSADRQT